MVGRERWGAMRPGGGRGDGVCRLAGGEMAWMGVEEINFWKIFPEKI